MIPYQQHHHPYPHQHQLLYQQHYSQPSQGSQASVGPPGFQAPYNQHGQVLHQTQHEQLNTVNINTGQSLNSTSSQSHQQMQHPQQQDQQVPHPQTQRQHPLNPQHPQQSQLTHAQAYESQPMPPHQQQMNSLRHAQQLQPQQYDMNPQNFPHTSSSMKPQTYDTTHVHQHQLLHYAQYSDQMQHAQPPLNRYPYQQQTHQNRVSLPPQLNTQHNFHEQQYNDTTFHPQYVHHQLHQQSYNSLQQFNEQSSIPPPPSTSSGSPMNSTSNNYMPPQKDATEPKIESPKKKTSRKSTGTRKKRAAKEMNEGQRKSGYAQFFSDKQKEIKSRYPTIGSQFGEISKIVSAEWSSLSDEDRKMYNKGVTEKRRESLSKKAAEQAKKLQSELLA